MTRASKFAAQIKPSVRGELEITTLNSKYLEVGALSVEMLGRGLSWFDTGAYVSLLHKAVFCRQSRCAKA